MAVSTISSLTARLRLENGTDDAGNTVYVSQSLGNLNETYYAEHTADAQNAILAIKNGIAPTLSKAVGYTETVVTSQLRADS